MPYAMPWHGECLARWCNCTEREGSLQRILTAYLLGSSKSVGTPNPRKVSRAMIKQSDLFIEESPSESDSHYTWNIRRAPPDRPLPLVVVSRKVFGVRTHYWSGRTVPCVRKDCPACAAGRLSRWTGYIACLDPGDFSKVLFEFTPPAAEQIQRFQAEAGFLREAKILATRAKKTANGRVSIAWKGRYEHPERLPVEPDLLGVLFHIWGMRQQDETSSGGYDQGELADHEKPKGPKKPQGEGPQDACANRIVRDLAGQLRLPLPNGERER
jgi:hypothetical protein